MLAGDTPHAAGASDRVFASIPRCQTLRADLGLPEAAPASGPCVDFHSLRVSCATMLAASGVPLTTAQRFLRHSDPRLTANVYTKVGAEDLRAASAAVWGPLWVDAHSETRQNESYSDPRQISDPGADVHKASIRRG